MNTDSSCIALSVFIGVHLWFTLLCRNNILFEVSGLLDKDKLPGIEKRPDNALVGAVAVLFDFAE